MGGGRGGEQEEDEDEEEEEEVFADLTLNQSPIIWLPGQQKLQVTGNLFEL